MDNYNELPDLTYTVYVKLNDKNEIVNITSSAFLTDTESWIEIDSGIGDKFHHAQNNYFSKSLVNENGLYNFKLVDGQPVEQTSEDKASELARIDGRREIAELKTKLAETDYIAAKIAEGAATTEEYADKIKQRAEWRARINELEGV